MKKKVVLLILIFFLGHHTIYTWGFFAHYKINKMAVFTLPENMNTFFLNHIELLEDNAVNADKRRHRVVNEAPRHYIDIDYYSTDKPFEVVPRKWHDAIEKYTEDTLLAYGTLPWNIKNQYYSLVESIKQHNVKAIIKYSSDIGHYIADAHVPLHTTLNYNGQLTNQDGIHSFWESRLPELFADNYDYILPKVTYIDDILEFSWSIIENSHNAKDSVLLFEAELNERFSSDEKYSFEEKGSGSSKVYSLAYSTAYHKMLDGMVERQMRSSIVSIGSVWYSAWIDAGQPNMDTWIME
jgi:hypothetical protein